LLLQYSFQIDNHRNNTITFSAFQSVDLENLMRGRLEDASVVDPKAISYIAKKYANANGDARPAMEVLTTALNVAKERARIPLTRGGAEKSDGYIVKIRDVFQSSSEFTNLTKLINHLSSHGKLMVCAAVDLARMSKASDVYVSKVDLIDAFRDLFYKKFGENSSFSEADAWGHIKTLDDIGLAVVGEYTETVVFTHTPEELDAAVSDSLGKESDFYDLL
jgi:Cdc6-like AAA superfamily ATPase